MADSSGNKKINFFSADRPVPLKFRKRLKVYLLWLLKQENKRITGLNIIFCSDNYLLRINQEYLNHDDYTDVITFDLGTLGASGEGEIYVSVDRVKENAVKFHNSFASEIHRVIFHGLLHLAGYRDGTVEEKVVMREKEEFYLQKYSQFVSRETRST